MSENTVVSCLEEKIDELVFWAKFSAWTTFVNILRSTLRDDSDKLVYELSDGKRSTREIAQFLTTSGRRITHTSVANLWQKWYAVPIVVPGARVGRFRKVVALRSAGIESPSVEGLPGQTTERSEG